MIVRPGRDGGWFGVVFGVGAFMGTATGRAVAGTGGLERITIIIGLVAAGLGFTRLIRSGSVGIRSTLLTLTSITSIYAVVAILDLNEVRWPEDRGDARSMVMIEGTFLHTARPRSMRGSGRDSARERMHIGRFRVDSEPVGDGSTIPIFAGQELDVRILSGPILDAPGVRMSVIGRWETSVRSTARRSVRGDHGSRIASITVPDSRLIRPVIAGNRLIHVDWLVAIRSEIRERFRRGIESMASSADDASGETSLLWCLLTGDRDGIDDRTRIAFRRSGVSHLLAISGLHMAVLASVPWVTLGLLGVRRRIRCVITAVFVIGGLMIVDSGPSVIRAASMIIPILAGAAMGMMFGVLPLLGVVAGGMLWVDPGWVDSPGFQLSFVATSALAYSCRAAQSCWFGPRDSIGRSRVGMIRERWSTAATASIVACIATLPIVESRFGVVPLCLIPASIVVAPLVLVFLAVIVPTSIISMMDPTFGVILSRPIVGFEQLLRDLVAGIAEISPVILTIDPGAFWTISATVLAVTIPGHSKHPAVRRAGGLLLTAMIMIPMLPFNRAPIDGRLRVDMLAVGDGSAILVRTPRSTVLFDAGSSSIPGFGAQSIFSGLRSLGVRRLDGIVISHANTDHYGAIPYLVGMIPTKTIVVTPAFLRRIHRAPDATGSSDLFGSIGRGTSLRIAKRGDRIPFPDGDWLVLHPDSTDGFRRVNDESMSIRISGPSADPETDSDADLILLGDLETIGVLRLMDRTSGLRARVMELPHHGSWRPAVVELIEAVDPIAVLQSSGPRRFETDRFHRALRRRARFVTCRDGSIAVTVGSADSMRVETTRTELNSFLRSP